MTSDHKPHTDAQRNALHLWLRQCATLLNDAGMDVKTVLAAKEVEIPWTEQSFKEIIFRPIYEALTDKESTTKADSTDYDRTYHILVRHFGQKLGVTLPPFPDRFSQEQDFAARLYKE